MNKTVEVVGYPTLSPEEYYSHAKAILVVDGKPGVLRDHISLADLNLAVKLLSNYLSTYNQDASAFTLRAITYQLIGDMTHATSDYTAAILLDPTNIQYQSNLAHFYLQTKNDENALAIYKILIIKDPMNADTHRALAVIYEHLKQPDLSNEHALIGYELDPTDPKWEMIATQIRYTDYLSAFITDNRGVIRGCIELSSPNASNSRHLLYSITMETDEGKAWTPRVASQGRTPTLSRPSTECLLSLFKTALPDLVVENPFQISGSLQI